MSRLSLALIRVNMIKAHNYFPAMSRRQRLRWAIAKAQCFSGPKCQISSATPKVPAMFVRSMFK